MLRSFCAKLLFSLFLLSLVFGAADGALAADLCADFLSRARVPHATPLKALSEAREAKNKDALSKLKLAAGRYLIDESFSQTAKHLDEIIIRRSVNEASMALLEKSTAPKPLFVKTKSIKEGLAAGFVPRDPKLSQPTLSKQQARELEKQISKAIDNGNLSVKLHDSGIEILADELGRPIVADVDLWGVARKLDPRSASQTPRFDESRGWLSEKDSITIAELNDRFFFLDSRLLERELVQHGPWTASKENGETDYPLTAYLPSGEIVDIRNDAQLRFHLGEWASRGYVVSSGETSSLTP